MSTFRRWFMSRRALIAEMHGLDRLAEDLSRKVRAEQRLVQRIGKDVRWWREKHGEERAAHETALRLLDELRSEIARQS